ncbi:MAG: hypothetical protein ABII72_03090 [Parcubacteria group bacterium]
MITPGNIEAEKSNLPEDFVLEYWSEIFGDDEASAMVPANYGKYDLVRDIRRLPEKPDWWYQTPERAESDFRTYHSLLEAPTHELNTSSPDAINIREQRLYTKYCERMKACGAEPKELDELR